MIRTAFTELLGVKHPVVQAGMSSGTSPDLVAAVSNAGGLGILGVSGVPVERIPALVAEIRAKTRQPFGLNLLLFGADDDRLDAVIDSRPDVLSTAWPRDDQNLADMFARAHEHGLKVMHMVPLAADADVAAAAGADVIVAQGTDGGGHIGLIGTAVIVPRVVRNVAPVPVLAAGGIADGRGLAAMLAMGAAGVLMGTRFLTTTESTFHEAFKKLIVESDATDTVVTDVSDVMFGEEWPGALARVARNRVVERWLGRENELRRRRDDVLPKMIAARKRGDVDEATVLIGQSAALIDGIVPAAQVVEEIVAEAEAILRRELPKLLD